MTIALVINVNEGAIIASDSASTRFLPTLGVTNVYNNANKIFNLYKGLPIGMVTYGLGSIGPYSIALLAKELRAHLKTNNALDPENYLLSDIADRVKKFMFDENYEKELDSQPMSERPDLGFLLTGYSSGKRLPETYLIETISGVPQAPILIPAVNGIVLMARGMPEAVLRLIWGISPMVIDKLVSVLQLDEQAQQGFRNVALATGTAPIVDQAMPLQDAIDVAQFLVNLTINFQRFMPGAKIVGGPIEIATTTKHEGFRWIQRKHYYGSDLNPKE